MFGVACCGVYSDYFGIMEGGNLRLLLARCFLGFRFLVLAL